MTTTLTIYSTLLTVLPASLKEGASFAEKPWFPDFIIEIIHYFTNKEPHYQKMKEQNRILDQLEKGYFTNKEPHYQKMKEQNRILDQLEKGYFTPFYISSADFHDIKKE